MKIRESIISDISHLETLFLITRLSTFSSRRKECQIVDYIQSTADDKVWVGEVDGTIVGFISVY
jgi:TolB-like protein